MTICHFSLSVISPKVMESTMLVSGDQLVNTLTQFRRQKEKGYIVILLRPNSPIPMRPKSLILMMLNSAVMMRLNCPGLMMLNSAVTVQA